MYRLVLTVYDTYKVMSTSNKDQVTHKKTCDGSVFMHTMTSPKHFRAIIKNSKGIAIAFVSAERSEGI